jgi:hypothetical protein
MRILAHDAHDMRSLGGHGPGEVLDRIEIPSLLCLQRFATSMSDVWETKVAVMSEMKAQRYLQTYYAQGGNHARRAAEEQAVRYAESFQRVVPQVVSQL